MLEKEEAYSEPFESLTDQEGISVISEIESIATNSESDTCLSILIPPDPEEETLRVFNGVVLQFIELNGLEESFKVITDECRKNGLPLPEDLLKPKKIIFTKKEADDFMKFFDLEQGENLWEVWEKFMSGIDTTIDSIDDFVKLTLFVRVFKSVIVFRTPDSSEDDRSTAMASLGRYFHSKLEFQRDDAFLNLFAMPLVIEPQSHPKYANLFKDSWKENLRSQITICFKKYFEMNPPLTRENCYLNLMYNYCSQAEGYMPPDPNANLNEKVKYLKSYLEISEERYYRLLRVTSICVQSLEGAIAGRFLDLNAISKRIQLIFPEIFEDFVEENE